MVTHPLRIEFPNNSGTSLKTISANPSSSGICIVKNDDGNIKAVRVEFDNNYVVALRNGKQGLFNPALLNVKGDQYDIASINLSPFTTIPDFEFVYFEAAKIDYLATYPNSVGVIFKRCVINVPRVGRYQSLRASTSPDFSSLEAKNHKDAVSYIIGDPCPPVWPKEPMQIYNKLDRHGDIIPTIITKDHIIMALHYAKLISDNQLARLLPNGLSPGINI